MVERNTKEQKTRDELLQEVFGDIKLLSDEGIEVLRDVLKVLKGPKTQLVGYGKLETIKRNRRNDKISKFSEPKVVKGKCFYFTSNWSTEEVEKIEHELNKAGISCVWGRATYSDGTWNKELEQLKALYLQKGDMKAADKILDMIAHESNKRKGIIR